MDLDTTVRGFALTHESAERAFREIMAVQADDDWEFEFDGTEDVRVADDYPGVRVHLRANYAPMSVPLTVDVTTGDRITPDAVEYSYPLLFGEGEISLMAYPIETVLAEKLETVVSRGVANTRPRDTGHSTTSTFYWVPRATMSTWRHWGMPWRRLARRGAAKLLSSAGPRCSTMSPATRPCWRSGRST